ncbi:glutathione S-transferase C-terminal domain-containing protein [Roseateles amylovorans]|jgi:glutathione S-transferase|uniref:Glutathione S-transferase N-terminal domain-containing protein n=1 Tax=Roseateles amylovorans TaxID=2978473 RepID=A0ABY6B0U2_9BURK|nr:glutathione S-transferase C-terminal domain-containing protein [Roseateles amylovorans]UXH78807.1 glutathione S-transferase N-terminal domain-containing protein [Roseateles amylovorans]
MTTASLRVLGRAASINVRKVLWTGVELGLDVQREDVDVTSDDFRALNPNAMMPVLIDARVPRASTVAGEAPVLQGGVSGAPGAVFSMWESNSICRYLVDQEGRVDLLPTAARERALVEMWMDWQATELNNSWRYAFMGLVRRSPAHQDAAQLAAGVANWNRHMGILAGQLQRSGGPFVLGARFTLADVVLGLSTHRWRSAPIEHAALPALEAYYQRLCERPGFFVYGRDAGP